MKKSALKQTSSHIALGKMIVILDEGRDAEKHKTLKGYVQEGTDRGRWRFSVDRKMATHMTARAAQISGECAGDTFVLTHHL